MRCAKILSVAAIAAVFAMPAVAAPIEVSGGWFRALPAGLPAGGYFVLHNNSDKAMALTGAASPACGMVMLHESMNMGGMERMEMVKSVTVPAHGEVAFKPGGYHLMCMKPTKAMMPGATVPVTLDFADGSNTQANFAVKDAKGE